MELTSFPRAQEEKEHSKKANKHPRLLQMGPSGSAGITTWSKGKARCCTSQNLTQLEALSLPQCFQHILSHTTPTALPPQSPLCTEQGPFQGDLSILNQCYSHQQHSSGDTFGLRCPASSKVFGLVTHFRLQTSKNIIKSLAAGSTSPAALKLLNALCTSVTAAHFLSKASSILSSKAYKVAYLCEKQTLLRGSIPGE